VTAQRAAGNLGIDLRQDPKLRKGLAILSKLPVIAVAAMLLALSAFAETFEVKFLNKGTTAR
jgi:hypothetical protein